MWFESGHGADLNFGECIGFVGGSDVNPKVVRGEATARLLFALEVDRLLADDTNDRTLFALDDNTKAWEHVGVDATNLIEIQETALVDIANHETNFIGMSHEHDLGARASFVGNAVANGVGCDFVDKGAHLFCEERCDLLFAT